MTTRLELLTNAEMADADRLAAEAGVSPMLLMESGGRAVADEAGRMSPVGGGIIVVCGPGNNGGDGFVAARLLQQRGFQVHVALLGERDNLRGDAAAAAALWPGPVLPVNDGIMALLAESDLCIDAMFGAGLRRPLFGAAAVCVLAINASKVPVLCVDVPSGLNGSTGAAVGPTVNATRTVTFVRLKPGHLLLPGRIHCGVVHLVDIGLPDAVLQRVRSRTWRNAPGLWHAAFPRLQAEGHKYGRGHAVVVSGPPNATGAARLGARGALRVGSGLVTVASPLDATGINAAQLTAIMLEGFEAPFGLESVLSDRRRNAILIGPGCGVTDATRQMVRIALAQHAALVLDADALTVFATPSRSDAAPETLDGTSPVDETSAEHLFKLIKAKSARPVVLTPHEGEFRRLFGDMADPKLDRARAAAYSSGAVVVLKGADTVIAAPDGRAAVNDNGPPWLATAGSGDVLAGFITGLLAQGMPAWEAACAGVWLHGACATAFGPGLIAEDLPEMLPRVLNQLLLDEPGATTR